MRILMTTDTVGGVWTFTQQLSVALLTQHHSVALVSFGRTPSPSQQHWADSTLARFPASFCFASSPAPLEWMQLNEQAYESGAPLLLALAREFSPEVLLTSQYCFGALPVGVPKIVVAHSDVLSWASVCRKQPLDPGPWLEQYVRLVSSGLAEADAVVAPTLWMLGALSSNFTLPQHSVVIYNGRCLPDSSPSPLPQRHHQAVSAGRFWDEAKNLKLLETLASPLPIVVAGDSGARENAPTASHVRYLGELSEDQVLTVFRESSIYLCTSIYEPFGLAPLEAALCGCAVVANDIPSLREVWGECALFFEDPASLSATLRAVEQPKALKAAQQRSCERARLFTATRMTDRYINLFERLLRSGLQGTRSSAHAA